ncbi:hypothetical protein EG327_000530 [Venturia inaequalis]|uniref:Uncharacterized protein n=1 Tax=Venturia inaequalis TaxID=5025 RepID=A0A8H3Z9W2_VENIN|nr:hypothetical protein EG327_000530 [Venturia inaequalis]
MDNQLPFGFSSSGLRRDLGVHRGLEDQLRPGLVPTDSPISQNDSSRYLSLLSRFCDDEHFANTVDEWNDFEVPQRKDEIRRAAHFAPPACSLIQLQYASHNSMQRWVYRILTLNRSRIEPNRPICVSHTMALQELVAWWILDGAQSCSLKAREELVDPTQAHGAVWIGSCRFARQIMCDMLWLELCNLRGERHSIELATKILQVRVAEYMQPSQNDRQFNATAYQQAPKEHRRIIAGPQNDRGTMRRPIYQDESKRGPHNSTLTLVKQVNHTENGTTDTPQRPDRHQSCYPNNQASSIQSRDMQSSDTMNSLSHQHDTELEKSMHRGKNGQHFLVKLDGNPQLQTARVSLDKQYQGVGLSSATAGGETYTAEERHEKRRAESVDFDGEILNFEAAIVHDWLELPHTDSD